MQLVLQLEDNINLVSIVSHFILQSCYCRGLRYFITYVAIKATTNGYGRNIVFLVITHALWSSVGVISWYITGCWKLFVRKQYSSHSFSYILAKLIISFYIHIFIKQLIFTTVHFLKMKMYSLYKVVLRWTIELSGSTRTRLSSSPRSACEIPHAK